MGSSERLYGLALRFLAVRGRSRWEMQQYLEKKTEDTAEVKPVMQRLEAAGLINDRAFAENWIGGRQAVRPRSKRRLLQELGAKRVPKEVIGEVLEALGADDEMQALESVARKKLKLARYQDPQRLASYLVSQGYEYAQIKEALERLGFSVR